MKKLFALFTLLSLAFAVYSTHNRAGEITYVNKGNLTYEITITTYTDIASTSADRCTLDVDLGDGTMKSVMRSNGPQSKCQDARDGEVINGDTKVNKYITTHTYAGPGTYVISMLDPNRVAGIQNIPNSVSVPFFLRSVLVISPTVGHNNSPVLLNMPIDNGCLKQPFYHNPGAVDPENDSLVYSIGVCYGDNGDPIQGYTLPSQILPGANNQISINPNDGTLFWNSPQLQGEYNVCIVIEEYRRDSLSGTVIKVGEVLRDMQIKIAACNNTPPEFSPLDDVCVLAGDSINQTITAYDRDSDVVTLTAVGLPLEVNNPAIFTQGVNGIDTVRGKFRWQTDCNHILKRPYQVTFKAEDNRGLMELVNFATLNIRVVGPPSDVYSAEPIGNDIRLNWSVNPCSNTRGYNIYRKIDSLGYTPSNCITGVPQSTGYQLIAFVPGYSTTTFLDNNNQQGLVHGHRYCYMITAVYDDKSESYPTPEFCAQLKKDVPVITRVSVANTSLSTGKDTITWAKPTELNTNTQFLPPYSYKIYRLFDGSTEQQIGSIGPFNNLFDGDTVFVDSNLNTQEIQYKYRIEMESSSGRVGFTQQASSPFLNVVSKDKSLRINWNIQVPWSNYSVVVYKFNPDSNAFYLLDTTTENFYIDTGLVNGNDYCYKIKTLGRYSTSGFKDPLINFSQEACGVPRDSIAPCEPPNIFIEADCDLDNVYLQWDNPNLTCADDVAFYKIYFTEKLGGEFIEIHQSANAEETSFSRENLTSLAGCYAVTAIDSSGNESNLGERFCVDNCPIYELPNIFTPGGDGYNDLLIPFPYKYVESIDLKIYNRWGKLVFETTNPNIAWNGVDQTTNKPLASGVYFYVCTVNEIRLTGIEPRVIKGNITIVNQTEKYPTN